MTPSSSAQDIVLSWVAADLLRRGRARIEARRALALRSTDAPARPPDARHPPPEPVGLEAVAMPPPMPELAPAAPEPTAAPAEPASSQPAPAAQAAARARPASPPFAAPPRPLPRRGPRRPGAAHALATPPARRQARRARRLWRRLRPLAAAAMIASATMLVSARALNDGASERGMAPGVVKVMALM
jgi:hypothetical protein